MPFLLPWLLAGSQCSFIAQPALPSAQRVPLMISSPLVMMAEDSQEERLRALDEQIQALNDEKAAAVQAEDFFKAGDVLEQVRRLEEERDIVAQSDSDNASAQSYAMPADLKALSNLPDAAVRASARKLAEVAKEEARARAAAAADPRTPKQKLEQSTADAVTGKSFANGVGGLFKALTGIDIRSDELKKKPPR